MQGANDVDAFILFGVIIFIAGTGWLYGNPKEYGKVTFAPASVLALIGLLIVAIGAIANAITP